MRTVKKNRRLGIGMSDVLVGTAMIAVFTGVVIQLSTDITNRSTLARESDALDSLRRRILTMGARPAEFVAAQRLNAQLPRAAWGGQANNLPLAAGDPVLYFPECLPESDSNSFINSSFRCPIDVPTITDTVIRTNASNPVNDVPIYEFATNKKVAGTTASPVYFDESAIDVTAKCAALAAGAPGYNACRYISEGFMVREAAFSPTTNPGNVKFVVRVSPNPNIKLSRPAQRPMYQVVQVGSVWQYSTLVCPVGQIKVNISILPGNDNSTSEAALNAAGKTIAAELKSLLPGGSAATTTSACVDPFSTASAAACQSTAGTIGLLAGYDVTLKGTGNTPLNITTVTPHCITLAKNCTAVQAGVQVNVLHRSGNNILCEARPANSTNGGGCPNGYAITGIGTNGNVICAQDSRSATIGALTYCGPGTYLSGFDSSGTRQCLPDGSENVPAASGSSGRTGRDGFNVRFQCTNYNGSGLCPPGHAITQLKFDATSRKVTPVCTEMCGGPAYGPSSYLVDQCY